MTPGFETLPLWHCGAQTFQEYCGGLHDAKARCLTLLGDEMRWAHCASCQVLRCPAKWTWFKNTIQKGGLGVAAMTKSFWVSSHISIQFYTYLTFSEVSTRSWSFGASLGGVWRRETVANVANGAIRLVATVGALRPVLLIGFVRAALMWGIAWTTAKRCEAVTVHCRVCFQWKMWLGVWGLPCTTWRIWFKTWREQCSECFHLRVELQAIIFRRRLPIATDRVKFNVLVILVAFWSILIHFVASVRHSLELFLHHCRDQFGLHCDGPSGTGTEWNCGGTLLTLTLWNLQDLSALASATAASLALGAYQSWT